jgi:electron transport complex protein RnfG
MKKDFLFPIIALTAICLLISAALAVTNSFTEPVIAKAAAERAEAARAEVIPEADGFEPVLADNLPASVTEAYRATNGAGYVFMITTAGYGGEIKLICGIGPDGKITETRVLSHSETKGLGSKIAEPEFAGQFPGKGSDLSGVDAISGATISSKSVYPRCQRPFKAYELVRGVQS